MTNQEFSEQFDTLLDSYKLKNDFGADENLLTLKLDEYEKSVFLTQAQNDLIIELYTGRNPFKASYEETEELRRYLGGLNKVALITTFLSTDLGISPTSVTCTIEDSKLLYIVQEQCKVTSTDPCINNTWMEVAPIKRDDYNRHKSNPFRNSKIWRLDLGNNVVELVTKHTIISYKVTYLAKPLPIILEDIDYVTIEGLSSESPCKLPAILHKYLLEKAVYAAYNYMATKANNTNNNTNN